jgi:hypothetical protein
VELAGYRREGLHSAGAQLRGWCERNSEPDSRSADLYSTLVLARRQHGPLELSGVVTDGAEADRLLDGHLAAVNKGVGVGHARAVEWKSWLAHALDPAPGLAGVNLEKAVFKLKDALLRKRFTDRQIEVAYHYLTRTDHDVGLTWGMATYGGNVNAVAPDATASAQKGLHSHDIGFGRLARPAGRSAYLGVGSPVLSGHLR